MGCASSTKSLPVQQLSSRSSHICNKYTNEKSTMTKLDVIKDIKSKNITGKRLKYKIEYCYVNQRGYYPRDNKANQDSYLICENVNGDEMALLFGIFDGHGEKGDLCSYFVADTLPLYLEKEIQNISSDPFEFKFDEIEKIYTKSFTNLNLALRKSQINDSYSGTTAITVMIKGDNLYVANIGDSRAIIGSESIYGELKYSPLSKDQTPFRRDERQRLKQKGAKIMTCEQIQGTERVHEDWEEETGDTIHESSADPPRVWDQTLQQPGCAFTRSIGDKIAEDVGVFAEPEVLEWKISDRDRYIIIASDGVFEFLTNQDVINIVRKHEDILVASREIVSESYKLWLNNDERTDDISIILIKLSCFDSI